jgi:hypothetical protein
MAALTGITSVRTTPTTAFRNRDYGATIVPGQVLYQDSSDTLYKLADNNASAATADAKGIAITDGINGGTGIVATGGEIYLVGPTLTVGTEYYVGPTAGEIIPVGDLTTGHIVTRLGIATSANLLDISIVSTGVVHA